MRTTSPTEGNRQMQTQATISAITGAVLGALVALVLSLVVVATAGPGGEALPATSPALLTLAGGMAGGLIGLFNP